MAPFFSPSPQIAFGLELNALSDDRTPFPHAVTMIMKGMTEMRIPFVKVSVLLGQSSHMSSWSLCLCMGLELCVVHM